MMGFGLIFTILLVIAFIYLLNERGQGNLFSTSPKGKSALDIAKERYARGELSKDEFELIRSDLNR